VLLICFLYYLSSDSAYPPVPETHLSAGHGASVIDNLNAAGEALIKHPPPPPPSSKEPADETKVQDVVDKKKEEQDASVEQSGDGISKTKGDNGKIGEVKGGVNKGHSKPGQAKSGSSNEDDDSTPATLTEKPSSEPVGNHPIDVLIANAEDDFKKVLARESRTVTKAAKAYRERRGRHPPPGFDQWFQFAQENDAVIVEDFFDRIYHDLNPFWGLDPKIIRKEAWDFEMTINIRNHNASAQSDWFWTQIWLEMFKTIEHLLPDMDVALNAMDEPRLVVPWEEIATYMYEAERNRKLTPVDEVISTFEKLPAPGEGEKGPVTREKHWEGEETSKTTQIFPWF
jgi:phosphoglycolate phosphatase-like HAD superfamily hydrolase